MQTFLVTISLFITTAISCFAQSPYEQGMQKALGAWQNGDTTQATQIFERIAAAEQDDWLPSYYAAMITIIGSFNVQEEAARAAQLEQAQQYLNDAKSRSNNHPEVMVLEAQWYTSWVAFDGEKYGMQYAPKVSQIYQEAAAIAPENPRVVFGAIEWEMGSARYFGADVAPYCEKLQKALLLYNTFESDVPFYPSHGLEYGQNVIKANCNQ